MSSPEGQTSESDVSLFEDHRCTMSADPRGFTVTDPRVNLVEQFSKDRRCLTCCDHTGFIYFLKILKWPSSRSWFWCGLSGSSFLSCVKVFSLVIYNRFMLHVFPVSVCSWCFGFSFISCPILMGSTCVCSMIFTLSVFVSPFASLGVSHIVMYVTFLASPVFLVYWCRF